MLPNCNRRYTEPGALLPQTTGHQHMQHAIVETPSHRMSKRDVRLDFFRGLAMFIIFIAHVPGNTWTLWIPARFGFSDATEIFVFCSGMASAIAFGGVYARQGWLIGTSRAVYRIWQVYWAHIALFLVIAAMLVAVDDAFGFDRLHIKQLNLVPFFDNPDINLVGLLTLTYVPNYFDILPMYIGILMLLPIVMAIAGYSKPAAGVFVIALWLIANFDMLNLPAEPWSDRSWFFNPFGWQLVFFTGFAFMSGWLRPPPIERRLIYIAIALLVISIPFAYFRIYSEFELLKQSRQVLRPFYEKSEFGIFRYIHFLALAYLAYAAVGPQGVRLQTGALWGKVVDIIRLVGQQSLPVFLASMVIAQAMGVALNLTGRNLLFIAAANFTGFALLIVTAKCAAFFKSQPWKQQGQKRMGASGAVSAASLGTSGQGVRNI